MVRRRLCQRWARCYAYPGSMLPLPPTGSYPLPSLFYLPRDTPKGLLEVPLLYPHAYPLSIPNRGCLSPVESAVGCLLTAHAGGVAGEWAISVIFGFPMLSRLRWKLTHAVLFVRSCSRKFPSGLAVLTR